MKNQNKIECIIIELLKINEELSIHKISEITNINWEPIQFHAKKLFEDGVLDRYAKGKPWVFYYSLNKGGQQ